MGRSKKIDWVSFVVFGFLVLSIVMAIVGVCIAWTSSSVTSVIGKTESTTSTLGDWAKLHENASKVSDGGLEGFAAMQAFAYITLALTALTTVLFVVSKFINVKFFRFLVMASAALLIISAIVCISLCFNFCGKYEVDAGVAATEVVPAAGAWLLTVFSVLGGGAGIVGAVKK